MFWLQVGLMNKLAPVVVLSADTPDTTGTATCASGDPTATSSQLCTRYAAGLPCPGYDPTRPLPDACPPGTPSPTHAHAEAAGEALYEQCLSLQEGLAANGQQSSARYDECQRIADQELARQVRAVNAQRQASAHPVDRHEDACPPPNRTSDQC
jgi:hypothetical protein